MKVFAGGQRGAQAGWAASCTSLTHTVHLITLVPIISINPSKLAESILKLAKICESATVM